ncbi:hypothetical protein [Methylobacterium sp. WL120]|uniref:hypothetical protein n=1 Tax=Methylobacterium sp. WL120 TaxID=2603887 RepID=UPI0011C81CF6|nr:hypothetical protein [Methylobacterium sp. WL120]TXM65842.1 hypothetical protein FV229_14305 [Methylobacterium sp. WL120]
MALLPDALTRQQITLYYLWLLERAPEPSAIQSYLAARVSRTALLKTIVASEEFAQRLERARDRDPWAVLGRAMMA